MNVHYIYCHPLPESFHAAIRAQALAGLKEAGHTVDFCDLYAEKFDPVMWADERRDYHDLAKNQSHVSDYVRRLRETDALVMQFARDYRPRDCAARTPKHGPAAGRVDRKR